VTDTLVLLQPRASDPFDAQLAMISPSERLMQRHVLCHLPYLVLPCLILLPLALATAGCSSEPETTEEPAQSAFPAEDPTPDCDPLQPSWCSLPWPSNKYLQPDAKRTTGYQLKLGPKTLPKNASGKHIAPTEYERLDGYGPGSTILVHFANLDISKMPSETDGTSSLAADSQVVLLKVGKDGKVERVPHFVELDLNAVDMAKTMLFVRPGIILEENTRYVVGFRNLKTTDGAAIEPSPAFAELRDNKTKGGYLAPRQARFDEVFALLAKDGVKRDELDLAWDFHTASTDTLHGHLLRMRDAGFKVTGDKGPELKITKVVDNSKNKDAKWAVEMQGTFTVPRYTKDLKITTKTASVLTKSETNEPKQNGTLTRDFWVRVPHSAMPNGAMTGKPHGLAQYGHGLLGRGSQVGGGHNAYLADKGALIFFACDWSGMAEADYNPIAEMVFDMSNFHIIVDGLHQGMMEGLLLARAMRERFGALTEVTKLGIKVDTKRLYFTGISQGGIYGGAYMALSQDITRGHLGVPGQNYSILLHRSVDFAPFFTLMIAAYSEPMDRAILLTAGQSLWDQVDASSHYRHLVQNPHAGTPKHEVLLASATGDYQVALLTNEITVRSDIGIKLMKHYGKKVWGVEETAFPHKGSGLVNWSFGNQWAKPGNLPPVDKVQGAACGPGGMCIPVKACDPKATVVVCELKDPHGKPRKLANHSEQLLKFFESGEIIDVCADSHCDPF
jgi:hypothetical protein